MLSLREKEFVDAAVAQGMRSPRIMFGEILPNLASTILVFGTLIVANNILLEAALSFLGAGIQPPEPSWGSLIADGVDQIYTAPHLSLVPGIAIVLDRAVAERVRRRPARRARPARQGEAALGHARFTVRRLLNMIFVLLAVSVLTFLIFNVIPGGGDERRRCGSPAATPTRLRSRP